MTIDPGHTYVLLSADGAATEMPGGEAFWTRPEAELDRIGAAWLVTEFECSQDWPNWEMHPQADEFVYLLAGDVTLLLQGEKGVTEIAMQGRSAFIVPKGTWHTAKVAAPSRMLFVTLGTGTQQRPVAQAGPA